MCVDTVIAAIHYQAYGGPPDNDYGLLLAYAPNHCDANYYGNHGVRDGHQARRGHANNGQRYHEYVGGYYVNRGGYPGNKANPQKHGRGRGRLERDAGVTAPTGANQGRGNQICGADNQGHGAGNPGHGAGNHDNQLYGAGNQVHDVRVGHPGNVQTPQDLDSYKQENYHQDNDGIDRHVEGTRERGWVGGGGTLGSGRVGMSPPGRFDGGNWDNENVDADEDGGHIGRGRQEQGRGGQGGGQGRGEVQGGGQGRGRGASGGGPPRRPKAVSTIFIRKNYSHT